MSGNAYVGEKMTKKDFLKNYWHNYLYLEKRFLATGNYVSIEKENNDAFSFEYLSLFILLCNEIDSISTEFCNWIEKQKKNRNIGIKVDIIKTVYPNLSNLRVITNGQFEGYNFVPFLKFDENSAEWWKDYTYVKHYRSQKDEKTGKPNYNKANLKNVFTALSALYLMSRLFFEKLDGNSSDRELISAVFNGYEG